MDWIPKTELGKKAAEGLITLDEIFKQGLKIKEPEIVDKLIPSLQNDIIYIGGSPGKGGGIRRTPTRRTARMHRSGRRYKVSAMVVIGNGDGYFGIGMAHAIEHKDAIDKAMENAKLNIIPIKRGCGSWECNCGEEHTIPMQIEGRSGSLRVQLVPAPKGIGLCINDEAKKLMRLAGVRDIWSKSFGESRTRVNYTLAIFDAFKKMNTMKIISSDEVKQIQLKEDNEIVNIEKEYELAEDEISEEIEGEEKELKKEIKKMKKKEKKLVKKEKRLEKLAEEFIEEKK
jgi:small subunit ribosomal protein S5